MTGTELDDATSEPEDEPGDQSDDGSDDGLDDACDDRSDVPPAVRSVLVQAASDALAAAEPVKVPASLRAVQRFTPRRRASAGAGPLWTALLQEEGFRSGVAREWAQKNPELAEQVLDGHPEPSPQAAAG